MEKKTFVLDTNVILYDSSCVEHFEEHDVVLPVIVLEELDKFKTGNQTANFHAREFVRFLDSLDPKALLNGSVSLGEGRGHLSIELGREPHADLLRCLLSPVKPDHQIINICYHMQKECSGQSLVLVTKDVNLRMKARAMGLTAENYTTDRVKDTSELYTGTRVIADGSFGLVDELHCNERAAAADLDAPKDGPLAPNEFIILKEAQRSTLATYSAQNRELRVVRKREVCGITPRNAEQSFAVHALSNQSVPLVTVGGKAGTGKTLLALASALEQRRDYRQIMLARPIVPLSNKDIGFLPGDVQSKIAPYMQPLYDNLAVIRGQHGEKSDMHKKIGELLEDGKLIIEPLAYIRGRSLVKMYVIIDEAQNLTPHEVKTIITRAGEGSKVVFTGDVRQIDHPYLDSQSNGLSYLIERMKGQHLYAHVTLKKGERSALSMLASELL